MSRFLVLVVCLSHFMHSHKFLVSLESEFQTVAPSNLAAISWIVLRNGMQLLGSVEALGLWARETTCLWNWPVTAGTT